MQRQQRHSPPFVGIRILGGEGCRNGLHVRPRLIDVHCCVQTPDGSEIMCSPITPTTLAGCKRAPQRCLFREINRRWHDPNDLIGNPIERERFADDAFICRETAVPILEAEDHHPLVSRLTFLCSEPASQERLDLKDGKESGLDNPVRDPCGGSIRTGDGAGARVEGCHLRKYFIALLPISERRGRAGVSWFTCASVALPHGEDVLWGWVGEWLKQHGVHDGEDRRVGPNAERERHQGDERESGRSPESAERIADVLEETAKYSVTVHGFFPGAPAFARARIAQVLAGDGRREIPQCAPPTEKASAPRSARRVGSQEIGEVLAHLHREPRAEASGVTQ